MSEELIHEADFRSAPGVELGIEHAWNIGKAVADWLNNPGQVAVAADARQERLCRAAVEGLLLQGRDVLEIGEADISLAIQKMNLAGGIKVGFDETDQTPTIAVFDASGRQVDSEHGLRQIHALVVAGNFLPAAKKGTLTSLA